MAAPALHRFWRLSRRRKLLLPEAVLAVVVASLVLKVLSFSVVAAWLGKSGQHSAAQAPDATESFALDIGWAVRAAALRMPWSALCLVQALAATLLARMHRLKTVLYLGVAHSEAGELQAHAWLSCGDRIITGEPSHERFKVVATFSA